ncbi:hypothetical protein RFI_33235, partial [Reticulomyxa filosa]
VNQLSSLDGSFTRGRKFPSKKHEYHNVEPLELVKLREKARNTILKDEEYVDTADFFNYTKVPAARSIDTLKKGDGRDPTVPSYIIPEKSTVTPGETYVDYKDQIAELKDKTQKYINKKPQTSQIPSEALDTYINNTFVSLDKLKKE